jgi:hypothetical protein
MISMIRTVLAVPTFAGVDKAAARRGRPTRFPCSLGVGAEAPIDGQPIWVRLPIAEAACLSPSLEMPRYCEALRCQSKQQAATTVHALITGHGEANLIWVACADCTGLMIESYAT